MCIRFEFAATNQFDATALIGFSLTDNFYPTALYCCTATTAQLGFPPVSATALVCIFSDERRPFRVSLSDRFIVHITAM